MLSHSHFKGRYAKIQNPKRGHHITAWRVRNPSPVLQQRYISYPTRYHDDIYKTLMIYNTLLIYINTDIYKH